MPALLRSCARLAGCRTALRPAGTGAAAGSPARRRTGGRPARRRRRLPPGDRAAARRFFETRFRPWSARNHRNPIGLFTGYYEPLLHGSRRRHGRFTVPLYGRPPELVMVDLGHFRDDLKGKRIAGRVEAGALVPYPDRKEIDDGALAGRKLEIVWVDDPVEAFFLQVQGSGRVRLEEGGEMRVGYAAQNGRPYASIGKALIDRGALAARRGLAADDPRLAAAPTPTRGAGGAGEEPLLRLLPGDRPPAGRGGEGPLGAEGVPLTPGRSLAVDLKYLPLGVPVWLAGGMPAPARGRAGRQAPPPARRPGHRRRHPRPGARRRLLRLRAGGGGGRRADEAPREALGAAAEGRRRRRP